MSSSCSLEGDGWVISGVGQPVSAAASLPVVLWYANSPCAWRRGVFASYSPRHDELEIATVASNAANLEPVCVVRKCGRHDVLCEVTQRPG